MTDEGVGRDDPASWAERIAAGHAYRRHVVVRREYPLINDRQQFAALIEDVIVNADEVRALEFGRYAYWRNEIATLVIVDPGHRDGGSAFRPTTGKTYFDELT